MALNVLVVDDSSVMRMMIIKTIKMTGIPIGDICEAANGQEGLEKLDEHWIDLGLVDINMPVMNGEAMIERIRASEEHSELPIIVISTESSSTRIERLEQKEVTFVHKPFTPKEVKEVIRSITGVSDDQIEDPDQSGQGAFEQDAFAGDGTDF